MKKTQRKDALRNITKRIVSYLSVCLVVTLGLGGLFTTRYMGAGLNERGTGFYDEHDFKDYELVSSYGITEDNLQKIRSVDKVTEVEGVIQADGSASFGRKQRNVTVISITEKVSVPSLCEGVMPQGTDECLIGEDFAEIEGLRVGDRLKIYLTGMDRVKEKKQGDLSLDGLTDADGNPISTDDDDDGDDTLSTSALYSKEFTITGLMIHPDYLRRKAVNTVCLPLDAFDPEVTEGLYTRAFVRIEEPEGADIFSQDFFDSTADTQAALEAAAEELKVIRTQEVKDSANAQIDEEWAKAEAKLQEGQDEIDAGQKELDSKLAEGRKKLTDAEKLLAEKLKEAGKKLKKGELTLAEYEKLLAEGKSKYDEGLKQYEDGKKQLEEGESRLAAAEKEFAEKKELFLASKQKFDEMMGWVPDALTQIDYLVENWQKEEIRETEGYRLAEKAAAIVIIANQDAIRTALNAAISDQYREYAEQISAYTGTEVTPLLDDLKQIADVTSADNLINDAYNVRDNGAHFTDNTRSSIQKMLRIIENAKEVFAQLGTKMDEAEALLAQKKQELAEGKQKLAEAETQLAAAKKQIEDGEKQIAAGKKKLAAGKKKLKAGKAEAEKKIADGWATYYSEKEKYEGRLAEAVALLAENRGLAEAKLAEARAEVENIDSCEWIVLDRRGNAGYMDLKTNLDAVASIGVVFGLLFAVITAIVCFSTLVIIIDEQRKMVGTVKAFGFYKREILGKYMVFGVSSAVTGSILAVLFAWTVSEIVQVKFTESGMYSMGTAGSVVTPVSTVLFSLFVTAVTIFATFAACIGILRSPASMLMDGALLGKEKKGKKKPDEVSSKRGTLYSRLLIRNMKDDKARVTVTIAIIAFSCMLIGVGINMKLAYDGMMERQVSTVNRYDIRMDMNDDVTEEEEKQLAAVLDSYGTDYLGAASETLLYRWNGKLDGLQLICGSPSRLGDFYGVTDYKTGQDIALPEDGILIQKRMHESYGMDAGDELTILDSELKEHEAPIKGLFANYVGRTIIMSPAVYKDIFGRDPEFNVYYIKLGGADMDELEDELLAVTDNVSFERADEFRFKLESASKLYNLLVYITTGIAIFISFMILTNLSNIYLNRKRTELTVMRVNGFTIRETRGYLLKETLFTTAAGLVIGAVLGALSTPYLIKAMQQPDLEFIKSFQPLAWGAAVVIEALFSLVINTSVFKKVKDLDLRDIT